MEHEPELLSIGYPLGLFSDVYGNVNKRPQTI